MTYAQGILKGHEREVVIKRKGGGEQHVVAARCRGGKIQDHRGKVTCKQVLVSELAQKQMYHEIEEVGFCCGHKLYYWRQAKAFYR